MVNSIFLASVVIACVASVSAVPIPGGSIVDIFADNTIGVDNLEGDDILTEAINLDDLEVKDVAQDVDVLSDDNDDFDWRNRGFNRGDRGNDGGNGNGGNGGGRGPINRPDRPGRGGNGNGGNGNGGNGGGNHGSGCGCGCKRDGGLLSGLLKRHEDKDSKVKQAGKEHKHDKAHKD